MDFIEYINSWVRAEVLQGKIMIGVGFMLLIAFITVFKSENVLLKGTLIPMGLLLAVLLGYGGYILKSRPAHANTSIELYKKDKTEAI